MSVSSPDNTQDIGFIHYFEDLEDFREALKIDYPLEEVLLLVLCGVLAMADGWVEIVTFGEKKLPFLRRFLPFENGILSHDQLGYIFRRLDDKQFRTCFIAWSESLHETLQGVVAIDGKALRRSFDKAGKKGAIHMVSAWSSEQNLVLAQTRVDKKSNEITAIPQLLDLLTLQGTIVTIDAMGCQRKIAEKILDKKAGYILALKGNQGKLSADVKSIFEDNSKAKTMSCHETLEHSHGRIDVRRVTVCTDIEVLQKQHKWPGLKSIVMIEHTISENGNARGEMRFYISSLDENSEFMARKIRDHWGIENGLHWIMDVIFHDDDCRIRKDNAPANFTTIKHMASNLLRNSKGKKSMNIKRHMAAWDEDFLFGLIAGK